MQKYCNHCMSNIEESTNVCSVCGHNIDNFVPAHHLLPGTLLNNKFYVGEALGEGGFGITYIGRDINLDIKVAIKEYYPNGYVNRSNTTSPQVNNSVTEGRKDFFTKGRERFLNEARILAKFSGEGGIVDVRDFFEENNTAYIVMEFLDGKDLKNYLKENGTLTAEQTINLLMPVMNSLKKVHSQNLIHRDISPDNIMLVGNKVKLLDFGAARSVAAAENKSLSVMLKPGYAPEEQYRSKGNQGPWTDVYALCATMYKCITGITPDDATQRVFSDEVKTPTALGIKISSEIENAIMRGMSVHQKDRYQNIDDLIRGLQGIEVECEGKDTPTLAANKKIEEDDIATRYEDNESELVTEYGATIERHDVKEDDIETRYEGENKQFDVSNTNEESKESETNNNSDSTEVDVINIDNKKIDYLNEDYLDIYSSSKADECNDNQENVQPEYFYDSEETKQEKIKDILDNVIQENEQNVKKEFKSKRIIAAIIIAIIAILAIIIIVIAIMSSGPKNKIDPTVEGFIFTSDDSFVLHEPEGDDLYATRIYSEIEYNEKMFFGSYTLKPNESSDDELEEYKNTVEYSDIIYAEDGSYFTTVPYKIVAGPNSLSKKIEGTAAEIHNWMELYYYHEDGYSHCVTAAYEVSDKKLIIRPAGDIEDLSISFYSDIEYVFDFSGPYLTLTYDSNSVTLLADGFAKEIVGNNYVDYYSLYVNNMVSPDSSTINNIHTIRLTFNDSYSSFCLTDSVGAAFDEAIGRMTEDGLFTFSYSDGHEKNTQYFVNQYVYFYCGNDGLILTDGENIYYYQDEFSNVNDGPENMSSQTDESASGIDTVLSDTDKNNFEEILGYLLWFDPTSEDYPTPESPNITSYDYKSTSARKYAYDRLFAVPYYTLMDCMFETYPRRYWWNYETTVYYEDDEYFEKDPKGLFGYNDEVGYSYAVVEAEFVESTLTDFFNLKPDRSYIHKNSKDETIAYYYDGYYYYSYGDGGDGAGPEVKVNSVKTQSDGKYVVDATYFLSDPEGLDKICDVRVEAGMKTIEEKSVWSFYMINEL